jgi:hypothetical protein
MAQASGAFSGLWILDTTRQEINDVYGEIRIVRQTQEQVDVTMVDYGAVWADGAFTSVVNIIPWTFRFDRWGPRRGPADSKEPITRARWNGPQLILEKSTFSGNGNFTWTWNLKAGGTEIHHQKTAHFVRSSPGVPAVPAVGARINVRVKDDLTAVLVDCPEQDCRIIEIVNAARTPARPLSQAQAATLPLDRMFLVEPVGSSR